jgi:acyl-CoA synthetase (AMP-forming)/AMP-acid ligase II
MTVAVHTPHEGTLCGLLLRASERERWLILPVQPRRTDEATVLTFAEILVRARARARALLDLGAQPGRNCLLVFDNDAEFVISFFAAQWANMVAVPWHPPHFVDRTEAYQQRLSATARHCDAQFALSTAALIRRAGASDVALTAIEELDQRAALLPELDVTTRVRGPQHVAVIQYTSGSTGSPKAVELTHSAILANVRSIGTAVSVTPRDVVMCWLPMFHDMGLFGSLIFSLYWQLPLVLMTPRSFILRPQAWLWSVSRFAVTLCPAPNFAYQLCVSKVRDETIVGLDLSSWRVAFNGSECVQATTVRAFSARFASYGFGSTAMYPVYGLAENVVAACFPSYGQSPAFDWIDRKALTSRDVAEPCPEQGEDALGVACVGRPLMGQRARVVHGGSLVPDRHVGEIELDGPCKLVGYHRAQDATSAVMTSDGWLRTGDLGYFVNGQLFVIGRSKNVIKRGGETYHAADIEAALCQIPGVLAGYVAVCGVRSDTTGTEELVVLLETRKRDRQTDSALKLAIARRTRELFGITPEQILLLPTATLPRTTSGKVRHALCKEMLTCGELHEREID